jgi:hypothetical protein
MPYVEPEAILQAKQMDLFTYLQNYEPNELVHVSGNVYCTKTHDSLKISNGKWCWFSRGIGGKSALDYLIKVKELSFVEAVEQIVGQAAVRSPILYRQENKNQEKNLILPERNENNEKVKAYLSLELFEGKDWRSKNQLSLAGVYPPKKDGTLMNTPIALSQYLKDRPHIKTINLHLDNDYVGRMATKALIASLSNHYTVFDEPPKNGKDYNDQLCNLVELSLKKQIENYTR